MAQDNPFGDLLPGAQKPSYPGIIQGPISQRRVNEENRAQEDQALQREANARAQQDQILQIQANERAERAEARAAEAAARTARTDAMGSESERTAGFLTGRIKDAVSRLGQGAMKDRSALAPTFGVEAVRKVAGDTAANYITDDERQVVRAAQMDILDAALTLGTGAAYTKEQLEGYREAYFPKLGDSSEAIASKNQALKQLLENARVKAGRSAPDIEAAMAMLDQLNQPMPEQAEGGEEPGGLVGAVSDDTPSPYDPGGPLNPGTVDGNSPAYAQFAAGVGGLVEGGINNSVGIIANPLGTILGQALGYEGQADVGATVRQGLGLPYGDPTIEAINQAAAGGFGMAGIARGLSNFAGGATRNALMDYGSRPYLDMISGGTAAASGEIANQMGAGPAGQAMATIVGGATPSALSGIRGGFNALNRAPSDLDRNVIAAGQRQGVPIRQPDAIPSRRGDMANVAQTPHGGPMVQAARNADTDAMEARVTGLSDGTQQDQYAAGQTVQAAANRHKARTMAEADRLYTRAQNLAGDVKVAPKEALQALDGHIAELKAAGENANAGAINYLEGLRADLGKGLDIQAMQNLRSNMRGQINERSLTGTDTERRVGDVITAMNRDLAEQLPEGAATALDAADQFYRGRMEFIKQVSERFLGPKNNPIAAETAAQRLLSMVNGKGDADRFARMWKELEPAERQDLSATIAASLGRKANGEFSLSTLVRSLDPVKGINPRTARLVFGEDGARAIADLRTIANAKTATQAAMNNSNTGATVTRAAGGLKTLMLGAMGYSAGGPAGAVAGAVSRDFLSRLGEQRAARLLLNPDFTKMMKRAPNTANPAAINGWFRQVTKSAAKSQVYAQDVKALQSALAEAFSQSPRAVAASEGEQENN